MRGKALYARKFHRYGQDIQLNIIKNNSLSFVDSDKQIAIFFSETESSAKVIVQGNNAMKHILSKIRTECTPHYRTLHITKLPTL